MYTNMKRRAQYFKLVLLSGSPLYAEHHRPLENVSFWCWWDGYVCGYVCQQFVESTRSGVLDLADPIRTTEIDPLKSLSSNAEFMEHSLAGQTHNNVINCFGWKFQSV